MEDVYDEVLRVLTCRSSVPISDTDSSKSDRVNEKSDPTLGLGPGKVANSPVLGAEDNI